MTKSVLRTVISSSVAVLCGIGLSVAVLTMPVDRPGSSTATRTESATGTDAASGTDAATSTDAASRTDAEETTEKMNYDNNFLILVNAENPLPDDFTVTLAQIGECQAAASVVSPAEEFIDAAAKAGYTLTVRSGYRTAEEQQRTFQKYYDDYVSQGLTPEESYAKAELWAMKPGCSEHETGLALDINPVTQNEDEKTAAYNWLAANCADYGFILRYPKDKTEVTGVAYERWHFRYVGKEAAEYIMANNITLEEYLQNAARENQ